MGKIKDTVVFIRAATTVLTRRIREKSGTSELLAFRRQLKEVREENQKLRQEMERLKGAQVAPITQSAPASTARPAGRAASLKRRRVVGSDEDSDSLRAPPNVNSASNFLLLPTPSEERGRRREKRETPTKKSPATMGPTLGGRACPVEPIPLGLSAEDQMTLARLREQRDNVLSQLDPILARMSQLEVFIRDKNLVPS